MKELRHFIKQNVVFVISFFLAIITSFIVTPDKEYLGYIDYKTIVCLFSVLAVVCALKNVNFFYLLAVDIVKKFKNLRTAVTALIFVTLIGSMFIANETARRCGIYCLTLVFAGVFVLSVCHLLCGSADKVIKTMRIIVSIDIIFNALCQILTMAINKL